jgi:hypothetical protein
MRCIITLNYIFSWLKTDIAFNLSIFPISHPTIFTLMIKITISNFSVFEITEELACYIVREVKFKGLKHVCYSFNYYESSNMSNLNLNS